MFHQKNAVIHKDSVDSARPGNNLHGLGNGLTEEDEREPESSKGKLKPEKKEKRKIRR